MGGLESEVSMFHLKGFEGTLYWTLYCIVTVFLKSFIDSSVVEQSYTHRYDVGSIPTQ